MLRVISRSPIRARRVICATVNGEFERIPVDNAAREAIETNRLIRKYIAKDYSVSGALDAYCDFCYKTVSYAMSIYDDKRKKRVGIIHISVDDYAGPYLAYDKLVEK